MSDIRIFGAMKVKSLQKQFQKLTGAHLRVYKGVHFAEENAALETLSKDAQPYGTIIFKTSVSVENFEKMFKEKFGITVQVAKPDNSDLAVNSASLKEAGCK
ncbi:MAG: hypothetical protein MJZ02_08125 [Paludibacteraceae bacterium]|nr:hypothetical protein [Paludibacteraceae bacterium]